jgi:hypothetical protein
VPACRALAWRGSKEVLPLAGREFRHARHGIPPELERKGQPVAVVMIGVDPHKGSCTAVVIGVSEEAPAAQLGRALQAAHQLAAAFHRAG